jgi:hypothetical protein
MSQSLFGNISMEEFLGSPSTGISLEEADAQVSDSLIELERLNFALPRLEYLQAGVESTTEEISAQTISVIDFALEALVGEESYKALSGPSLEENTKTSLLRRLAAGAGDLISRALTTLLVMLTSLMTWFGKALFALGKLIARPVFWAYRKVKGKNNDAPDNTVADSEVKGGDDDDQANKVTMPVSLANLLRVNNRYFETAEELAPELRKASNAIDARAPWLEYDEFMGVSLMGKAKDLGDNPLANVHLNERVLEELEQILVDNLNPSVEIAMRGQRKTMDKLKALKKKKDLTDNEKAWVRDEQKFLPHDIKRNRMLVNLTQRLAAFLHRDPRDKESTA